MNIGLLFLRKHKTLIVQFTLVFCVTAFVTGLVVRLQNRSPLAQPAFSFQDQSSGPAIGESINLAAFQSRSGRGLAQVIKGQSLAMAVVVDPNCGACTAARDSLSDLRDRAEKAGIVYYVLMFPEGDEGGKYFAYADSLKLDAESFVWSSAESKPPISLITMVVPSHLLLTAEGLIVDKWTGINKSATVRERMVDQIIAEATRRFRDIGTERQRTEP